MSRVDDLIDLVRTINDILLVNEVHNVRTVFIQVDDLCELSLKSYLQANVDGWDPVDGEIAGRPRFKRFWTVMEEVRDQFPQDEQLSDVLDRFGDRREERNYFFHDHSLSGLTVTREKCLGALCDLYVLLGILFPDFWNKVEANNILKAQIAVIRLKREMWQDGALNQKYQVMLAEWRHGEDTTYLPAKGVALLRHPCLGYEFSVIYMDARGLYEELEDNGLIV